MNPAEENTMYQRQLFPFMLLRWSSVVTGLDRSISATDRGRIDFFFSYPNPASSILFFLLKVVSASSDPDLHYVACLAGRTRIDCFCIGRSLKSASRRNIARPGTSLSRMLPATTTRMLQSQLPCPSPRSDHPIVPLTGRQGENQVADDVHSDWALHHG
jgi:hypothetical protein